MEAVEKLRSALDSLTPSELDGVNDLKLLFLETARGRNIAQLEDEIYEIEAQAEAYGERLHGPELKAEFEILLARLVAVMDARRDLLRVLGVLQ